MKIHLELNEAERQELLRLACKEDDFHTSIEVYSGKVAHLLLKQTSHLLHDEVYRKAKEIVNERT